MFIGNTAWLTLLKRHKGTVGREKVQQCSLFLSTMPFGHCAKSSRWYS